MKLPPLDYVSVEDWIVSQVKGKSVLHLGCAGDYLKFGPEACLHYRLNQVTKELYGVEIDEDALNLVKAWVPEDKLGSVSYFRGDVQDMVFLGDKRFDVILAGSIIEHLSNPGLMLEEFTPLLKEEGQVVIVTPHVFGLLQFLRVLFKKNEAVNAEHTCWFSIATLTQLCARYGLKPVKWYTGYGWRPQSFRWSIQKTVGVPFFRLFPQVGGSLIGVFCLDVKNIEHKKQV